MIDSNRINLSDIDTLISILKEMAHRKEIDKQNAKDSGDEDGYYECSNQIYVAEGLIEKLSAERKRIWSENL